jgi:hypothetical protein
MNRPYLAPFKWLKLASWLTLLFELYFYAAHAKNLKGFVVDGTGFYKWFAGAYFE